MLDRINSIEKLLSISIPALIAILDEDQRLKPAPFFNITEHFRELEKGLVVVAGISGIVEWRLALPSRLIDDPPRPIHTPRTKAICREHRQLRRCLHVLSIAIDLRQEILQHASNRGWYHSPFFPRVTEPQV